MFSAVIGYDEPDERVGWNGELHTFLFRTNALQPYDFMDPVSPLGVAAAACQFEEKTLIVSDALFDYLFPESERRSEVTYRENCDKKRFSFPMSWRICVPPSPEMLELVLFQRQIA
jgi:hypothetical protein